MTKSRLYIDGVGMSIVTLPDEIVSYDAEQCRSVDAARQTQYIDLVVVGDDPTTASLFGGEGSLHLAQRFNQSSHTGELRYEEEVIFSGEVTLRGVERDVAGRHIYNVRLSRSGAEWGDNASAMISALPIEFEMNLRESDIKSNWEDETLPIQFFAVHRDDYESEQSSVSLEGVRRLRSIDDYHPFLRVKSMMESIAEQSGYTIESSFAESEEFGKLYMSGSYVSQENDVAKAKMDFCVKKCTDEQTTGDILGRVYIGSYVATNSVSSFVDIESLESDDDCFSTGDYLSFEDGAVRFTPPTSVSVGFEYRVKYTTGYKIASRTRLTAFDAFYFGEYPLIEFEVLNTFEDQRYGDLIESFEYLVVMFDAEESDTSTLYRFIIDTVEGEGFILDLWSGGRTRRLTTLSSMDEVALCTIQYYNGSTWVAYEQDWALYQGYVEESGECEIDVTLRSSPSTYSPSSPKIFDSMRAQGGEEGMSFALLAGTSVTPYFSAYPGYGSVVDWEELSQHEVSQSKFWESIQHLFNLRYYSDTEAKKIYLEPLEQLYAREERVWDWSDRIVESESVTFEDAAIGVARSRKWGYQDEDGTTNRSNSFYVDVSDNYPTAPEEYPEQSDPDASSPDYGSWEIAIDNYASEDSSTSLLNPIFSPTQNTLDGLPIVGDRDDASIVDTLEFDPRIVSFEGMITIDNETLPNVVFHSEAEGVNLCFEDRNNMLGLNSYYAAQIDREESGQYVTLTLELTPFEMAQLLSPVEGAPSVLSQISLTIEGEWVVCWIESIISYDIESERAKIKFLIIK